MVTIHRKKTDMDKKGNVTFEAGSNIAMKIPPHQYDATVRFYRDILRLPQVENDEDSLVFEFGDKRLWLDKVNAMSQAEIWLEVHSENPEKAARYLEEQGVIRRDEIEPLPDNFTGFWITNPAGIIHLVT